MDKPGMCVFRSAQRLHALQLELTAVQLLREQLEESIKTNEELRDNLEREMHRAKLREGVVQTHEVVRDNGDWMKAKEQKEIK